MQQQPISASGRGKEHVGASTQRSQRLRQRRVTEGQSAVPELSTEKAVKPGNDTIHPLSDRRASNPTDHVVTAPTETKGETQHAITAMLPDNPEDLFMIEPFAPEEIGTLHQLAELTALTGDDPLTTLPRRRGERQEEDHASDTMIDGFRMYLRAIGQIPLLTSQQEYMLGRRIEKGELERGKPRREQNRIILEDAQEARNRMLEANLRLVVSVAKRYMGRGLSLEDMVQEGNIGLMRAVTKFDAEKGYKFSTYATWWIRQAISRAIADQSRLVRLPNYINELLFRSIRISRQLLQELGRQPTTAEIAERLQVIPERVEDLMAIAQDPISLNRPVGDDNDQEVGDFFEDTQAVSPAEAASRTLRSLAVQKALSNLTTRERLVVELRFGFHDDHDYTLEEIGRRLKVTRERIRQIEANALNKLRHPKITEALKEFV